jgi:hypothetical protein
MSTQHFHARTSSSRAFVPAALVVLVSALSGCWQIYPALCETDDNCQAGFKCSGGICIDTTVAPGADGGVSLECFDNIECESGACVDYACLTPEEAGNVLDGDAYVSTIDEWNALQTVTTVTGDIFIGSADGSTSEEDLFIVVSGDVSLPSLRRAHGDIYFLGQRSVTSITLPLLRVLDGEFGALYMDELVSISLPVLSEITSLQYGPNFGELSIEGTPKLELFSAPQLTKIGWVSIDPGEHDPASTGEPLVVDLPLLQEVHALDVWSAANMRSLILPSLSKVYSRVYVRFPDGLELLSLPALESVDEEFNIYRASTLTVLQLSSLETVVKIELDDNDALTAIDMPALTTVQQGLTIIGHDALTSLTMDALTSVNNIFNVSENPALDVCLVQDIVDASSPGGTVTLDGNLGDVGNCQ